MLVNVVDVPPLCNFILPAIVRTGPLAIAISTAGASPALAKRMKAPDRRDFGEPYARLAVLLNEVRGWAKGTLPTYQDRKAFFEGIVNGEPDPIALLRAGDEAGRARADRGRPARHDAADAAARALPSAHPRRRSSPSPPPSRAARPRTSRARSSPPPPRRPAARSSPWRSCRTTSR